MFSNQEFSIVALIWFLLFSALLFVVLRLIRSYFPIVFKSQKANLLFTKLYPVFELFVWVVFLVHEINRLNTSNTIVAIGVGLLLLMIGVWLSWFALKDIIAGVVLKSSNRWTKGEIVNILGYKGKLTEYRLLTAEIETDNFEKIYLPYSSILMQTSRKLKVAESNKKGSVKVEIKQKAVKETNIEDIRLELLSIPWVVGSISPDINKKEETKEKIVYEINLSVIDKTHLLLIEKELNNRFL